MQGYISVRQRERKLHLPVNVLTATAVMSSTTVSHDFF